MMIGIVISFNSMDLLQYLRICYDIVTGRSDPQQYRAKITIHACCAHFMKMVSDRLSKENILNKRVKEMILKVMGLLIMCNSVSETDEIYTMLATISLSEKKYSVTKREIDKVNQILENKDLVISKSDIPQNSNINDIDNEYYHRNTAKEAQVDFYISLDYKQRNSKLFTKQTCSAGFENPDKPTVDEPPENEEKYLTIGKGLHSENEHSTRKEIGSEDNNRKFMRPEKKKDKRRKWCFFSGYAIRILSGGEPHTCSLGYGVAAYADEPNVERYW
ncbi:hypothetical protein J6590_082308 [Homalodisca vitripennis]|nr:hypothetical protein J6590_082308 [Homalodisca vitripennis]